MSNFRLQISTPDRNFYDDDVESVIVNTTHGEMGLLSHALDRVVTLSSGIVKIKKDERWMEAIASDGFLHARDNVVSIFVGVCEWPHEIDREKIDEEVENYANKLKKQQSLQEYKMAKAQLARQFAKLKLK